MLGRANDENFFEPIKFENYKIYENIYAKQADTSIFKNCHIDGALETT